MAQEKHKQTTIKRKAEEEEMTNIIPFQFGTREVRVHMDEAGNPWWVLTECTQAIGLTNAREAVKRIDPEYVRKIDVLDARGVVHETWLINEPGVYTLVLRSNKPEAKVFQKWVTGEVLPSIRKTGHYDVAQSAGGPLVQLAIAHEKLERQQQKQQQELLQAQQDIIALQRSELETKEHALLAIHSMQWVTIRQYVQIYALARQMPVPAQRSYSIWLTTYCLDRGLAMYKAATADKQWPNEKTYCITAIQQTLPGWLQRHGNSDQGTLDEETR